MLPSISFARLLMYGFLFLNSLSLQTSAASLDEAKSGFEAEDKKLNEVWSTLKKKLDEWTFEKVREEQRRWLNYRDEAAVEEALRQGGAEEGKEEATAEYWETRMYLTRSRNRMLNGWLNPGDYDDWSGEWIDGYGGLVRSVQKGDVLYFTIQVVRGPTYHTGSISGKATINRQLARFSDSDTETDKIEGEGDAWLNFNLSIPRLEINGANTGWYHGARAYFDGKYVRVGELTKAQAEQVLAGEIDGNE